MSRPIDPHVKDMYARAHALRDTSDNPFIQALALRILQLLWLHENPTVALSWLGRSE